MARDVLERAIERAGWETVDKDTVDAFLTEDTNNIIFFAGDSSKRPEAYDVAIILPELQKDTGNAFRVAVVEKEAFPDLKERFQVHFLPTLTLMHGSKNWGNIVRIQNWADYKQKITEYLAASPFQKKESVDV